jgi:hypothetical protein
MLSPEELEIFELAHHLRMPVYKLLEEMPYDEFVGWFEYFKVRPFGWREDHRVSMQLSAAGVSAKANELFPSLAAMMKHGKDEADVASTLKASAMFSMMLTSKGDKPDFLGA